MFKLTKTYLFFLLLLSAFSLNADIVTSNSIEEIAAFCEQNKTKKLYYVTDLDDTVAKRVLEYDATLWMTKVFRPMISLKYYRHPIVNFYDTLHYVQKLEPMETQTVHFLHNLQHNKIPLLVATARPINTAQRTVDQLQKIDLNFSINNQHLPNMQKIITEQSSENPAVYNKGIIYCGTQNKGSAISTFFVNNNISDPELFVVFVDDVKKHAISVDQAMQKAGIACRCFHYVHTRK